VTGVEGAAVSGAPTANTSPAPMHEQGTVTQSEIRENIELFKTKQIDRATYLANAARHKEAEAAGMVVAG